MSSNGSNNNLVASKVAANEPPKWEPNTGPGPQKKHAFTKAYEPKNRKAFVTCINKLRPYIDEDGVPIESQWPKLLAGFNACIKADGGPGLVKGEWEKMMGSVTATYQAASAHKGGKKSKKNSGKKNRSTRRNRRY